VSIRNPAGDADPEVPMTAIRRTQLVIAAISFSALAGIAVAPLASAETHTKTSHKPTRPKDSNRRAFEGSTAPTTTTAPPPIAPDPTTAPGSEQPTTTSRRHEEPPTTTSRPLEQPTPTTSRRQEGTALPSVFALTCAAIAEPRSVRCSWTGTAPAGTVALMLGRFDGSGPGRIVWQSNDPTATLADDTRPLDHAAGYRVFVIGAGGKAIAISSVSQV
jgi:hypothetical protein